MGVTIHYSGKLKSPNLIDKVREELKDIADDMSWKYNILDNDLNKPNTAKAKVTEKGLKVTGHLPLKGIQIFLHKDSEPLTFYFDVNGVIKDIPSMIFPDIERTNDKSFNSIKTQFAPIDIHITVIKLLKYLEKRYFDELEVFDEGKYWDTEDEKLLSQKIKFISDRMDMVEQILNNSEELREQKTVAEFVDKLEEILRAKLKEL